MQPAAMSAKVKQSPMHQLFRPTTKIIAARPPSTLAVLADNPFLAMLRFGSFAFNEDQRGGVVDTVAIIFVGVVRWLYSSVLAPYACAAPSWLDPQEARRAGGPPAFGANLAVEPPSRA